MASSPPPPPPPRRNPPRRGRPTPAPARSRLLDDAAAAAAAAPASPAAAANDAAALSSSTSEERLRVYLHILPLPAPERERSCSPAGGRARAKKQPSPPRVCLVATVAGSVALTVPQASLVDHRRATEVFDGFSAVLPPESSQMGDSSVEVTEESRDASQEAMGLAVEAMSEGKLEEAVEHLTKAILLNPTSVIMYGTRAPRLKPSARVGTEAPGVRWLTSGRYQAHFKDKKDITVGTFDSLEEAVKAREKAMLKVKRPKAKKLKGSKAKKQVDTAKLGYRREIIQNALKSPVDTIATNAGVEGAVIVGKLLEQENTDLGYDAAKGEYVDMVKELESQPQNQLSGKLKEKEAAACTALQQKIVELERKLGQQHQSDSEVAALKQTIEELLFQNEELQLKLKESMLQRVSLLEEELLDFEKKLHEEVLLPCAREEAMSEKAQHHRILRSSDSANKRVPSSLFAAPPDTVNEMKRKGEDSHPAAAARQNAGRKRSLQGGELRLSKRAAASLMVTAASAAATAAHSAAGSRVSRQRQQLQPAASTRKTRGWVR